MYYGPDDPFWVVLDPVAESEIGDVLLESSVRGLLLQFKGDIEMDQNPTIFKDQQDAEQEARPRLLVLKISKALASVMIGASTNDGRRIQVIDAKGVVVFEQEI